MEADPAHARYSELSAEFGVRLQQVQERIARAEERSGRKAGSVTLIAVTKTQTAEQVALAVRAGLRDVGENYIQEAQAKWPAVLELLQEGLVPTRHYIGHLQSNKARFAVDFDLVHTVDSVKLATELNKHAHKRGKVQQVLIEVNTARAAERAGVFAEAVPRLADEIGQMPHLALRGLMTLAPVAENAQVRDVFRQMYGLWTALPQDSRHILSMGMSGDFETAIEEGATHVRIGTALFGARPPRTR